jgi:hypothetical protein
MALNVYLTVFKKYTTKRLKDLEVAYVCTCYGIPAIPAIAFLFIKNKKGVPIYGSATLWCWISDEWRFLRIASFYAPVWLASPIFPTQVPDGLQLTFNGLTFPPSSRIILGITIVIYILAGRVIFRLRGSLRNFASSSQSTPPGRGVADGASLSFATRTMSPESTAPSSSYTVTVESGSPVKPVHRARRPRNSGAVEANTAAWAYCRCAMLFFLALLITWVTTLLPLPPHVGRKSKKSILRPSSHLA